MTLARAAAAKNSRNAMEPKVIIFDWGRTLYDNDNDCLFPGVPELLEYLSNRYRLAVVSLTSQGEAAIQKRWQIIRENGLEKHFSSILFTSEDKDKLYEETLRGLGVSPEEVVIVDDRTVRGIKFGNSRGAKTIWLKKGKFRDELPNKETGEPDYIISDIVEIRGLV